MTESFIQKYKPYYIDDFYFEPEKKDLIKTLLLETKSNMLFVGGLATGKTTFLYALIRHSYDLGCHDKFQENEVLFINNLKEQQGISYFRNDMKTFCQTRSNHCRKKMIVIDDMDLIHQQCQQVLCNYIDKYSSNVQFIFSCSNQQKIIENIQSRVQIIALNPPKREHVEQLYRRIVKDEGLTIEDPGVGSFLVDLSQQSLREMINIMEKMVVYYGSDAPTQVNELFKTRIHNRFQELVLFLRQGQLVQGVQLMRGIVANGYSLVDIFDAFFKFIKGTEELSEPQKYSCFQLLCRYITIIHTMHEETIEIVLFTNALFKILYIL